MKSKGKLENALRWKKMVKQYIKKETSRMQKKYWENNSFKCLYRKSQVNKKLEK